ncbi:MAG: nuclear transport factor 2 family protein [Kibdelosporangium sp.]
MSTADVVQAYHAARFQGDVPAAASQLADEFTFSSPLMRSDSAEGHLGTLDAFLQIVTGVDMISELYGDDEATLVYDVHTATPAGTQRTAEHFRLADGRITEIRLIFDATLWRRMLP